MMDDTYEVRKETFMEKVENFCADHFNTVLAATTTMAIGLIVWITAKAINRGIDNGNPLFGGYVPIFAKLRK